MEWIWDVCIQRRKKVLEGWEGGQKREDFLFIWGELVGDQEWLYSGVVCVCGFSFWEVDIFNYTRFCFFLFFSNFLFLVSFLLMVAYTWCILLDTRWWGNYLLPTLLYLLLHTEITDAMISSFTNNKYMYLTCSLPSCHQFISTSAHQLVSNAVPPPPEIPKIAHLNCVHT